MDRFIEYVSRFVPDFASKVQGASPEEIATLQRAVKRALPDSYKEFLARMGRRTGGISLGYDATSEIGEVILFHTGRGRATPPDCVAIGVGDVLDVCLHLPPAGGERVLASDGALAYAILAESLPKLLFQYAFRNHEIRSFPHVAAAMVDQMVARTYAAEKGGSMRDAARPLALELGFQPEWFTDEYSFCGRQDGGAIFVMQLQQQGKNVSDMGLAVVVGASTEEQAQRAAAPFRDRLGLKPYTYRGIP